jgi:hypothetical protein
MQAASLGEGKQGGRQASRGEVNGGKKMEEA